MDFKVFKTAYADSYLSWRPCATRVQDLMEELSGNTEVLSSWARQGSIGRARWRAAAETALGVEEVSRILDRQDGDVLLDMFAGTYTLAEELIRDRLIEGSAGLYFNPIGAQLNGQHEDTDVLNDVVYAAKRLQEAGLRVVYVDLDAHHSNQTERALEGVQGVLTVSVHDASSAGTTFSSEARGFANYPIGAGASNVGLRSAVDSLKESLFGQEVDVFILGLGTDGLLGDSTSSLEYTEEGLTEVMISLAHLVGEKGSSVLAGGGTGSSTGNMGRLLYVLGAEAMITMKVQNDSYPA